MLMDETQRLERFRNSELIARLWPKELSQEAEAYFPRERLLKNHLTGGAYQEQSDPQLPHAEGEHACWVGSSFISTTSISKVKVFPARG